ncbi:RTA1-domain-containing protein [Periconia macrospinosa]|uniref:RTA1-domain-containing protein n=1 Tax=Periconia macrospinosa TaxID=97972 RepID=A0A2V1E5E8_9PLEO|nr:RTA1-domain-containing protein [Periconia macrospinosa]
MIDLSRIPEPIRNPNNCHKDPIPGWAYSYGYKPSLAAGLIFTLLFALALFVHTFYAIRLRRWVSILLAVGALTELIGWSGRTWSSACPYNANAYLMQITTLIIAPVFVTGALYILLGMFITLLGREFSIISPRMYAIVFLVCDVISLVIQAVGGAMASMASSNLEDPWPGTRIMIGGVVFQLIAMTAFTALAVDFVRRMVALGHRLTGPRRSVLIAMFVSLLAIYARNIFRTVELAEGWAGYLMLHERYFLALDGALMVIAVGIFIAFDPSRAFSGTQQRSPAKRSSDEYQLHSRTPAAKRWEVIGD